MTRKELDHTAMEADKSQDVPLARRVDDVVQSKCWQNWDPERDVSVQFRRQERICVLALSSHSGGISSSVQLLYCVWLFVTPCTAADQASLSTTNSQSLLKFMSIESVMPSKHLILCCPLLLLPSIFPASVSFTVTQFFASGGQSIEVSASATVLPMNIQDWFPLEWTGFISLKSKGLSRVFSNTIVQKHQFFGTQFSLYSSSHIHTWLLEKP